MCTADVAYKAINGIDAFAGMEIPSLRCLFGMYGSVSHWAVLDSCPAKAVRDLKGMRIGTGMTASSSEITGRLAMEILGYDYQKDVTAQFLGLGEFTDGVRDGTTDAAHGFGGIPSGGFLDLAATKPTRMLPYDAEHLKAILDVSPFYYGTSIPVEAYPGILNTEPIPTFGVKVLMVVNENMDEQIACDIAKRSLKMPLSWQPATRFLKTWLT